MFVKNRDILEKIPCYIVGEKLCKYLIMKKNLPVFSIQNGKYYFRKTDDSDRIFKGEIPLLYRMTCTIEHTKGGEEN